MSALISDPFAGSTVRPFGVPLVTARSDELKGDDDDDDDDGDDRDKDADRGASEEDEEDEEVDDSADDMRSSNSSRGASSMDCKLYDSEAGNPLMGTR